MPTHTIGGLKRATFAGWRDLIFPARTVRVAMTHPHRISPRAAAPIASQLFFPSSSTGARMTNPSRKTQSQ